MVTDLIKFLMKLIDMGPNGEKYKWELKPYQKNNYIEKIWAMTYRK